MRRKLAGLILGTAIVGIVMAPAAGASQICNGQEIIVFCPPWGYGSVCISHDGVKSDFSDCFVRH